MTIGETTIRIKDGIVIVSQYDAFGVKSIIAVSIHDWKLLNEIVDENTH